MPVVNDARIIVHTGDVTRYLAARVGAAESEPVISMSAPAPPRSLKSITMALFAVRDAEGWLAT